jgi:hypothetical protein
MPPKEQYLLDNFNMTAAMWQQVFDYQQGLCGVCRQPLIGTTAKGRSRVINLDHDHKTGECRGLVCFQCNAKLREGFTIELVTAILNYITNPPVSAALGRPHYGLPGRVGTETRRKLIKKLRKSKAPCETP